MSPRPCQLLVLPMHNGNLRIHRASPVCSHCTVSVPVVLWLTPEPAKVPVYGASSIEKSCPEGAFPNLVTHCRDDT